jgi:hypothetical protein
MNNVADPLRPRGLPTVSAVGACHRFSRPAWTARQYRRKRTTECGGSRRHWLKYEAVVRRLRLSVPLPAGTGESI